jgi:hypothetical protein
MCERLVVVVIFRDLLQVEALVPALFLRGQPEYLFPQFVQSRYVVLRTAARDLADAVLRIAHVPHHDILPHLSQLSLYFLTAAPNMILYN